MPCCYSLCSFVSSSISEGEREEKRGEGKINRAGEAADNGQRRRIERERGKDLHLRASREDEDDSKEEGGSVYKTLSSSFRWLLMKFLFKNHAPTSTAAASAASAAASAKKVAGSGNMSGPGRQP